MNGDEGLLLISEFSFHTGMGYDGSSRDRLERHVHISFLLYVSDLKLGGELRRVAFPFRFCDFELGGKSLCKRSEIGGEEYTVSPTGLLTPKAAE